MFLCKYNFVCIRTSKICEDESALKGKQLQMCTQQPSLKGMTQDIGLITVNTFL